MSQQAEGIGIEFVQLKNDFLTKVSKLQGTCNG
jgi:hypothetical protein